MNPETIIRKSLIRKNRSNPIQGIFIQEFNDVFMNEEAKWVEIKSVFEWITEEAKCALSFADINAINNCRRLAELRFSKSSDLKEKVWKESRMASHELMNRFEQLRTLKKSTKGEFTLFEGHREEEKALPET